MDGILDGQPRLGAIERLWKRWRVIRSDYHWDSGEIPGGWFSCFNHNRILAIIVRLKQVVICCG